MNIHHKMLRGLCISDLEKNLCFAALEASGSGPIVSRCLVSDEDAPWPVDRCLLTIFLLLCTSVLSYSCKDISHTGLGPTFMASFNLI